MEGIPCYIAAELNASTIGSDGYRFQLGDSKFYGDYENIELVVPSVMVTVGVVISHVSDAIR